MYSISLRSPFVIISITADINNKRKEIKKDGEIEMKEEMNKSADCVGGEDDGAFHHQRQC